MGFIQEYLPLSCPLLHLTQYTTGMEEAFRVVNTLSDALGPITCIRFSPDGNRMAGASLDGNVYIYSVLENFKLEV